MHTNTRGQGFRKEYANQVHRRSWCARAAAFLAAVILASQVQAQDASATKEKEKQEREAHKARFGSNYFTKPFWNLKHTYRLTFAVDKILDAEPNKTCGDTAATRYHADKKSIFVEHARVEDGKHLTLIGEFSYINDEGILDAAPKPELNKPYMICVGGPVAEAGMLPDWSIRRAGGVDTGILVIPFKVRQGDLFSDSTIGPYFAFSGSVFTLLTTFGLTQVTVKASNETDVKTETGLTLALGAVWRLKKDWDIGLVVGADHLSGDAGRNFNFQDELWWSFAIGYQFKQ